ncbi:Central component in molecular interactions underlying sperm crawling [Perkinsus olseni]|uniref:Central component in molecular interactions underlying sperm crawling n=1 Tax=Perkinsus olseni TaxID=32597 RepID=A0A7J6MLH8_PEROL|nr:Central component in molecular interactions underlying sperm crawling [Perkinsus olseni]KAF4672433.1 Central component in molecular interactions underlying sperm crawling [Perkinsus olseni]
MPSLLSVKPGEIVFPNTLYQSVNTTLSLTNVDTEKKAVAFKIKTTAPRNYLVRPSSGVVAADATVDVQIILQPQTSDPSLNTDRFLIQATTSATGQPLERDEWARVAKSDIHEQRLHVIFKPAEEGSQNQTKEGGSAAPTAAPTNSSNIAAGELRGKYDELVQYTLSIEKEKSKLEKELEASKARNAVVARSSSGFTTMQLLISMVIAVIISRLAALYGY